MIYDIAVVGGGPAGLSAAVQARQRNRTAVVISGDDRDGPLSKTERVDNYLGIHGVAGPELLKRFKAHAEAMGVDRVTGRVLNIMFLNGTFYIGVGSELIQSRTVVLAPGVVRRAKFPGETEHMGAGVSYCATCDGMLYRGRDVVVVGRSAEAPEEAGYLHGLGCRVTYTAPVRPEELSPEIPFVKAARIEICGDGKVASVKADGQEIPCDGVFILRSTVAPADLLPALELRDGYIGVDRDMATNIPGVFAAGDCTGQPLQISKAVGEGQVAGHRAAEYLDRLDRAQNG